MAQFEPSRILDNIATTENVQQYVEIGANTFLGTKDGMQYTLIPTSDNKFKLCEVPNNESLGVSTPKSSWITSFTDESRSDASIASSGGYKPIKLIAVRKQATPCKGQGDGSGNSLLASPLDPSLLSKSDLKVHPGLTPQEENVQQLTYTTLIPKQEKMEEVSPISSYSSTFFQVPQMQSTPRFKRVGRGRPRLQPAQTPFPTASTPHAIRGQRQRNPRQQVFYEYKAPLLRSAPSTITSSSTFTATSSLGMSSSLSFDSSKESSISGDSPMSIEYPRVPNNTPEDEAGKPKLLELQQWMPQLQARIDGFMQMDPRETHNEKERKRRLRIKTACQSMKSLLPCVCDKTDNATVFENAVHFIAFMRDTIGTDYDMEFLEQNCMY